MLAGEHERPQVDVARGDAAFDERRATRQRERGLRDVASRVGLDRASEILDLLAGRSRADQHAVAAGAVHLLDHQVLHVGQRVRQVVGVAAHVGRHVLQDRLLAQVELDHLGHIRVDRLVICHAGANRIADAHVAGPVGVHQAIAAQGGAVTEHRWVEEVVVDAAIDHVDPLRAAGGAHVDKTVLDEQVLALDQLDAHLLRQEGVLEVRAVVHARRQHHHGRIGRARLRRRAQCFQQQVGIVGHRRHPVRAEQVREQPHHHLAVFQHVRHAAGNAQVVLQHVVLAFALRVAGPDDVDAGDVRVDPVRHVDAHHLLAELRVAQDLLGRDDAGLDDVLVVIDVVQEAVQHADPLHQAFFQSGPFVGRNDARNQVERDQPLGAGAFFVLGAIHREGDADPAKDHLRFFAALAHGVGGLTVQPFGVGLVVAAHALRLRLRLALATLRLVLPLDLAFSRQLLPHLVKFEHRDLLPRG